MSNNKSGDGESRTFITRAYSERLSTLREAQNHSRRGDIKSAVGKYSIYLKILANHYGVNEKVLSPKLFDKNKDITELLLISQAYWDLAKAYDRSPKLANESKRCLDQFVKFSKGFKYQHLNARVIRKFIRKKQAYNLPLFKDAHSKIKVENKGCFIATYAFSSDSPITNDFRSFRDRHLENKYFQSFIIHYYEKSPIIVSYLEKNPSFGKLIKAILRPALIILNRLIKICQF